ncbi:hypothetical protein ESA94_04675 [Lacibacter luteus]|uniref:Uncharacterized protein n=1 Tax=Lacibacter luteus TaxID=2508719 RepID=A0A4Q1CMP8_9BACT|nr:hypothetical protein [Lacibacter luteus]RXK62310.1 hypothetical protein ESA94_04675 [Lacibacter luteus]
MLKHTNYMVLLSSLYLLLFVLLIQFGLWINVIYLMFFFSPVVVFALAWSIVRHGKYNGKDFSEDQHWGYQDRPDKAKNK